MPCSGATTLPDTAPDPPPAAYTSEEAAVPTTATTRGLVGSSGRTDMPEGVLLLLLLFLSFDTAHKNSTSIRHQDVQRKI